MLDINEVMAALSKVRPVFHSEADFQHALAWAIHERYPGLDVRLEYPLWQGKKRIHIDILLTGLNDAYAIELKYGTTLATMSHNSEDYDLRNQSADDTIRYSFCKDVERLEYVKSTRGAKGYAIFLSNHGPFWSLSSTGRPTTYDEFRIHDGTTLYGELKWAAHAGPGSIKGMEQPIILNGTYSLSWTDYSKLPHVKGQFRYLMVEV